MAGNVAESLASTVTLNDGVSMPLFGLGVSGAQTGIGEDAEKAVTFAINNGYRLIDTAAKYGNESDVGRGIKNSSVRRDDVFVVTKLWSENHGSEETRKALRESLQRLDLDHVDLYLIHAPLSNRVVETYKTMLELKDQGFIRSVGVSNFGPQHLEGLKKEGLPVPSVNQIELHPWMQRRRQIVDYCRQEGITVMGYSPMARGHSLDEPRVHEMAKKYDKTVGQILIRWSVQNGYITIPKSVKQQRIIENSRVFDWSLKEEDLQILNSFEEKTVLPYWLPSDSEWRG